MQTAMGMQVEGMTGHAAWARMHQLVKLTGLLAVHGWYPTGACPLGMWVCSKDTCEQAAKSSMHMCVL